MAEEDPVDHHGSLVFERNRRRWIVGACSAALLLAMAAVLLSDGDESGHPTILAMKNVCNLWGCKTVAVSESQERAIRMRHRLQIAKQTAEKAVDAEEEEQGALEEARRQTKAEEGKLLESAARIKELSLALNQSLAKERQARAELSTWKKWGQKWHNVLAQVGAGRDFEAESKEKDKAWEKQLQAAEYWAMQVAYMSNRVHTHTYACVLFPPPPHTHILHVYQAHTPALACRVVLFANEQ
jgi:hypothetical protein